MRPRFELPDAILELDDAARTLLALGEAAAALVLELLRHGAGVARRAALAAKRRRRHRTRDGEPRGEPDERPERERPAALELRQPAPLLGAQLLAALRVHEA